MNYGERLGFQVTLKRRNMRFFWQKEVSRLVLRDSQILPEQKKHLFILLFGFFAAKLDAYCVFFQRI